MQTSTNVTASKPKVEGACWRAPLSTPLPTDATTNLNDAFKSLGYISEDGLTNSTAIESNETKAWGGAVVDSSQTSKKVTYKCKLIEALNTDVLKASYGDKNVTGELSTGIAIKINDKEQSAAAWVFEMILKEGAVKRIVVPRGKLISLGDVVYNGKDPIGYEVEILAEADGDGQTAYEYIKKGV